MESAQGWEYQGGTPSLYVGPRKGFVEKVEVK